MKEYWSICKGEFMSGVTHRFHFIFTSIGNLLFIILLYFLWKAIYKSSDSPINGAGFGQTFAYVSLATSIYGLFFTWTEWYVSSMVLSGQIVVFLLKPADYQFHIMFVSIGNMIFNLITVTIPSLFLIIFVFKAPILLGYNLLFFAFSIILSFLLNFSINFIVGMISFYTESIWGISRIKDAIVLLLSGSILPLYFFPDSLRWIVNILPFHAIYNSPLTILTSAKLNITNYLQLILIQIVWVVIIFAISRLIYNKAIKVLTVNGG